MQDRFKFRIWDLEQKKFFSYDDFRKFDVEFNFDPTTNEVVCEYDKKRYVVIQSTGLKDKNGKLVFECDIVKYDHEALHQVKWCYNCFLLKPCFKNGYTLGIVDDEIEIIGNIYENPELIGGAE